MTEPEDPQIRRLEERLERARPVPRPGFRGELRRHLVARRHVMRPAGLRRLIAAYSVSGLLLLAVAAAGLAGAGPLSA